MKKNWRPNPFFAREFAHLQFSVLSNSDLNYYKCVCSKWPEIQNLSSLDILKAIHETKIQCVSKKTPLKEMCDFLTLKMLPLALALIKTKNHHLFDPLVKNWPFSMENSLQASKTLNSHVKWAFSDQWVKKIAIFCFDQRQSQW